MESGALSEPPKPRFSRRGAVHCGLNIDDIRRRQFQQIGFRMWAWLTEQNPGPTQWAAKPLAHQVREKRGVTQRAKTPDGLQVSFAI